MTTGPSPRYDAKADLQDTYLSFRFELTKHLRRRRLLIVAALAVLVPLLFYAFSVETAATFAAVSLSFLSVLIVASAALFAGDAICGEFEKKTALLSFPTPQRRTSIFAGKYMAAVLATLIVVAIYYAIMMLQVLHLYGAGEVPSGLAQSFASAAVYSTSAVSVVFLLSSVLQRSISSTIVGFLTLLMVLPVLSTILTSLEVEPWFIVTYAADLISDSVVANGFSFGPGRFGVYQPDFGPGIAVMLTYTLAGFLGAVCIGSRKSME